MRRGGRDRLRGSERLTETSPQALRLGVATAIRKVHSPLRPSRGTAARPRSSKKPVNKICTHTCTLQQQQQQQQKKEQIPSSPLKLRRECAENPTVQQCLPARGSLTAAQQSQFPKAETSCHQKKAVQSLTNHQSGDLRVQGGKNNEEILHFEMVCVQNSESMTKYLQLLSTFVLTATHWRFPRPMTPSNVENSSNKLKTRPAHLTHP